MAAVVFPWWTTRAAGAICPNARQGIRGLAEEQGRELERAREKHRSKLEALHLPGIADDGDEPGLARHAGHVPDVLAAVLASRYQPALLSADRVHVWRYCRRRVGGPDLRPRWAPQGDCLVARASSPNDSALGLCAAIGSACGGRVF